MISWAYLTHRNSEEWKKTQLGSQWIEGRTCISSLTGSKAERERLEWFERVEPKLNGLVSWLHPSFFLGEWFLSPKDSLKDSFDYMFYVTDWILEFPQKTCPLSHDGSMYAIYGNMDPINIPPNVSIYTIHGSYGYGYPCILFLVFCKEIEVQWSPTAWPGTTKSTWAEGSWGPREPLALPWGYPLKIAGWFHGKSPSKIGCGSKWKTYKTHRC